jgi:hypothetical protein
MDTVRISIRIRLQGLGSDFLWVSSYRLVQYSLFAASVILPSIGYVDLASQEGSASWAQDPRYKDFYLPRTAYHRTLYNPQGSEYYGNELEAAECDGVYE